MANLCVAGSHSINGVSALHSEILKDTVFNDFYTITPDKFKNVTNGIAFRRWICQANPELTKFITELIGDSFITKSDELLKLRDFKDDRQVLETLQKIKYNNKLRFAETVKKRNGVELNPDSIFDVQVKRLHEYKRQLMNILHVMYLYNQLKDNPNMDMVPRTFIFGAKAAAGYRRAKLTIKLINAVADKVNHDEDIKGKLKVVFIEDYRVSNAEIIFAAADVSEQISTASKEASGTGNMKFMLNGALTLGTMDGANVEIADLVGPDNIYSFGASSNWIIELYEQKARDPKLGYQSEIYYHRPDVKPLVDFLLDPALTRYGDAEALKALWTDITGKDWFMSLLDVESYISARDRAIHDYGDKPFWARKMLVNTARCGFFSSDRTIAQYNKDIWRLK